MLSNLNMIENIALIPEMHQGLRVPIAEQQAKIELEQAGMQHIGNKRVPQCTDKEKFYAMLIRAKLFNPSKILIEAPFSFISGMHSVEFIMNAIKNADIPHSVEIADLKSNRMHYTGEECHILE